MSLSISIPSAITATGAANSGGGELGKLKKQLADLYAKLKQVSQGSGDAKQKMAQAKIIQTEIQVVQEQIQDLEKRKASGKAELLHQQQQGSPKRGPSGLLDVYV